MVEVSLTVGKLDASLALLLTKDHHLIEFPTILLPSGVKAGSIVKIKCDQDLETEKEESRQFQSIQDEILNTFGRNLPKKPILKIKNITQTSCVLEWDSLDLGTANLKNLILFKDGKKLGAIPQPLTNKTTKLSGLPIDKTFQFQLRLDTTAGVYSSDVIEVTTHKMTDLSGITVCLGDIAANEQFTVADIEESLKNMNANYPPQTEIKVDTTHFICTRENKQNPEYIKASDMNIPIVRPEWLKACERERRLVGVRDFYTKDCVLPDIFARNYWQENGTRAIPIQELRDAENGTENEGINATKEVESPSITNPVSDLKVNEPTSQIQSSENIGSIDKKNDETAENSEIIQDKGEELEELEINAPSSSLRDNDKNLNESDTMPDLTPLSPDIVEVSEEVKENMPVDKSVILNNAETSVPITEDSGVIKDVSGADNKASEPLEVISLESKTDEDAVPRVGLKLEVDVDDADGSKVDEEGSDDNNDDIVIEGDEDGQNNADENNSNPKSFNSSKKKKKKKKSKN